MPRSTNGPASRQRRKKVLQEASGFRGSRHRLIKTAIQAVEHAGVYSYRDRKVLADLAVHDEAAFAQLCETVKASMEAAS